MIIYNRIEKMSDNSSQQPEAEKTLESQGLKTRDAKGHLLPGISPQKEAAIKAILSDTREIETTITDFAFVNAFMAEKLGLSDKFADLSQQFHPDELFKHLKFVAMTSQKSPDKPKLGDNQQIVPITPQPSKLDIPGGEIIGKPNLTGSNFSLQVKMNPRELLKQKK